ncbi:calcium-binding protein [Cysteiniphilum sp. JM-1]|uniref:calcium-binding protein n=1 Tax=Cysteiniphilum sp. JM-1 TaxID=2610891 RepID=UPI0012480F59|nr:calcium-binding protein [Cysteiniphilum sp. JM-1]
MCSELEKTKEFTGLEKAVGGTSIALTQTKEIGHAAEELAKGKNMKDMGAAIKGFSSHFGRMLSIGDIVIEYLHGKPVAIIAIESAMAATGAATGGKIVARMNVSGWYRSGLRIAGKGVGAIILLAATKRAFSDLYFAINNFDGSFQDFANKFTYKSKGSWTDSVLNFWKENSPDSYNQVSKAIYDGVQLYLDSDVNAFFNLLGEKLGGMMNEVLTSFLDGDQRDRVTSELDDCPEDKKEDNKEDPIDKTINNDFNAAANAVPLRADPLVFDLDGDGVETVVADGSVLFDHNGDGVKYASGWVGADDALLVRDVDQNGQIDNGLELFGDNTIKANGEKATDGFDALSDLDDNNDGVFDHNDTAFDELRLWQDSNQDGVVQEGELKSLDDAGISSVDLNAINDGSGSAGGVIAKKSTYNMINGESFVVAALDFNANLFYREYHDDFNHQFADELETMDLAFNMQGSGAVRDLNQAALLNPDIANVVQSIIQTNSYQQRKSLYQELVKVWSQSAEGFTSAITTLEGLTFESGAQISFDISDETRQRLEKIAVLEAFNFSHMLDYAITENGENSEIRISIGNWSNVMKFNSNEDLVLNDAIFVGFAQQAPLINSAYDKLLVSVENNVFKTYDYQRLVDMVEFYIDDQDQLAINFEAIDQYFTDSVQISAIDTIGLLLSLNTVENNQLSALGWDSNKTLANVLRTLNDEQMAELSQIQSDQFKNGMISAIHTLQESLEHTIQGNEIVIGSDQNDVINPIDSPRWYTTSPSSSLAFNYVDGGDGDDWIHTESGSFYIDIVFGGDGNDYLASDMRIFSNYNNEDFIADALYGEAGDDVLHGGGSNNILDGGEGDDMIVARAGNNKVFGGSGDDVIVSGVVVSEVYYVATDGGFTGGQFLANSHTITEAGKGDDIIVSGYRNQSTYIYHLGDGHDVVVKNAFLDAQGRIGFNYDGTYMMDYLFSAKDEGTINDTFNDVLRFSAGISPESISLKRIEYDLQLTINEYDSVRLTNFYKALDDYVDLGKVSRIEFANGTVWQRGDEVFNITPENVHYVGTDQADSFHGTIADDVLEGMIGNDYLYGGKGDDEVFGGEGDDQLYGNDGDDILNGGQGNDLLVGGYGKNNYIFGVNFGRDEIQATHLYNSEQFANDTVVFTDGIMLGDVFFVKNLDDLIVKHANNQDQIVLKNFYTTTSNYRSGVNQFVFADDEMVDRSHMLLDPATVRGTPYDDKLIGSNENDLMYGQDGNDNLEGNAGDDTLDGGLGDDRLAAGAGDDTLIGGKGNDYLYGDVGHNRYVFSAMDGEDKVKKMDLPRQITENSSTLVFNEGIQLSDFDQINLTSFSQIQSKLGERYLKWHIKDLIFISKEKGLNITLVDYGMTKDYDEDKRDYSSPTYIEFNNGTERWQLMPHKAISMEINGEDKTFHNSVTLTCFDEVAQMIHIKGIGRSEYLQGTEGNDILDGGGYHDYLAGGLGADHYVLSNLSFNDDVIIADELNTEDAILLKDVSMDELYFLRDNDDLSIIAFNSDFEQAGSYQNNGGFYRSSMKLSGYFKGLSVETIIDSEGNTHSIAELLKDENKYSAITDDIHRIGSKGNDYIESYAGDDVIHAKSGDNWIEAGAGNNTITTGSGDDRIHVDNGNNLIKAGSGDNVVEAGDGENTIITGSGADMIEVGQGDNVIKAGHGENSIQAGSGNNQIYGGADYDYVYVEDGNNLIKLGNGDNELDAGDGDNVVYAGSGDDSVNLGDGNNTVKLGSGDNQVYAYDGDNIIMTGGGDDYIELGDGNNIIRAGHGDNEIDVGDGDNQIYSGNGYDVIYVYDGDNVIKAGHGDNEIYAGNGNNIITTGNGDDVIEVQSGQNTIRSGAGDDTVYSGNGSDLIYAGKGDDVIYAGGGNDQLYAQWGDNSLYGEAGNDTLYAGNDGADQLFGGQGDDTLRAKNGDDLLQGQDGDDTLIAHGDNNILSGGNGSDHYQINFKNTNNTIINNYDGDGSSDFMKLNGIKTTDLRFYREVSNLMIKNLADKNKPKEIIVTDWFESGDHQIDEIEVGKFVLSNKQIDVIIQTLASFNVETGVGEDLLNKDQQDEIKNTLVNAWMPKSA